VRASESVVHSKRVRDANDVAAMRTLMPYRFERQNKPRRTDMQLRDKIHEAINRMPIGALALLYDQIKVLENLERDFQKQRAEIGHYTLDEVHKLTEVSKTSWADTIAEDREDRI
jgi:hypothetical protein